MSLLVDANEGQPLAEAQSAEEPMIKRNGGQVNLLETRSKGKQVIVNGLELGHGIGAWNCSAWFVLLLRFDFEEVMPLRSIGNFNAQCTSC